MSAEATVNDVISSQLGRAEEATQEAIQYTDLAQTAAIAITSIPDAPDVPVPDIDIPDPFSTTTTTIADFSAQFQAAYDQQFNVYGANFTNLFNGFMATFFPTLQSCVAPAEDNWICNTILNGGTGIPAAIEQQIYDRGRERELETFRQEQEQALDEWAARGFSLPPGALAGRTASAVARMNDRVSTFNRETVIKNIEIEIENIRFAIAEATKLRLGALQAAIEYVGAWGRVVPQTAIAFAKGLSDAKISLYQNAASYYGAIVNAAEVTLRAEIYNSEKVLRNNANFVNLVNSNVQSRVQAAIQAAATLGQLAAASAAGLNTLANIGNITTQTGP